ncbi:hypothetical protein [Adhaeretor mobilis]|uniref:Uncharacterized protein n=1 Tax=Adhaeretor mobilis TaxID=1930276 RepID=A0A517MZ46_9BACT|nr:hypothetical protein [Adhaeretor mobilis]QDT00088.1 hypothetical protein HG15A2_34230 [Adhaeretor mobilis]
MTKSKSTPVKPQISVAQLLLSITFVAVAITVGLAAESATDDEWLADNTHVWLVQALFAAAATIVSVQLLQEVVLLAQNLLSQSSQGSQRFAVVFGIAWRTSFSLLLFFCIMLRLLIDRGVLAFGSNEDLTHVYDEIFPSFIVKAVIGIWLLTVTENTRPSRNQSFLPLQFSINIVVCLLVVIYLAIMLVAQGLTRALVHFAMEGVEIGHGLLFQRPGTYLSLPGADTLFFYLSLAVAVSWFISACLAAYYFSTTHPAKRRSIAAISSFALACCAVGYWYWYHSEAFPLASPDFASEDKLPPTDNLIAFAFLAIILSVTIAYRLVTLRENSPSVSYYPERPRAPILALSAAIIACCVEVFDYCRVSRVAFWEELAYLLIWPPILIDFAISALSLIILHKRWNNDPNTRKLELRPLLAKRFLTTVVATLALMILGALIADAFTFSYWVGPWARW